MQGGQGAPSFPNQAQGGNCSYKMTCSTLAGDWFVRAYLVICLAARIRHWSTKATECYTANYGANPGGPPSCTGTCCTCTSKCLPVSAAEGIYSHVRNLRCSTVCCEYSNVHMTPLNLQGQAPHHQLHQQYLQAQSHIQQQGQYRQQQQPLANTAPGLAQPVMQTGMQQGMRPQQGTRPAGPQYNVQQQQQMQQQQQQLQQQQNAQAAQRQVCLCSDKGLLLQMICSCLVGHGKDHWLIHI